MVCLKLLPCLETAELKAKLNLKHLSNYNLKEETDYAFHIDYEMLSNT